VLGARYLSTDWANAEEAARAALTGAVSAFHWLDDVAYDLDGGALIDVDSFTGPDARRVWGYVSVFELVDRAHELAHLTGELVGGLFGCRLIHDGHEWTKRCPLSLMHIRLGHSPGMTVIYACGICGQDPSECDHELGRAYEVAAESSDGHCNVCYQITCEHAIGHVYRKLAGRTIIEGDISEVSLVPRPRDPLTRITSIGGVDEQMRKRHGFIPSPDTVMLCNDCMYPCTGFSFDRTAT